MQKMADAVEHPAVRTMQFLVERACPRAPERAAVALERLGVHVVWVVIDSKKVMELYGCGAVAYRVTNEDREAAAIKLDQLVTGAWVCEHMGHLIE